MHIKSSLSALLVVPVLWSGAVAAHASTASTVVQQTTGIQPDQHYVIHYQVTSMHPSLGLPMSELQQQLFSQLSNEHRALLPQHVAAASQQLQRQFSAVAIAGVGVADSRSVATYR